MKRKVTFEELAIECVEAMKIRKDRPSYAMPYALVWDNNEKQYLPIHSVDVYQGCVYAYVPNCPDDDEFCYIASDTLELYIIN